MTDYQSLDMLKARLDSLRPISQEKLRAIQEKFRLEWTYHSNAIEGNPLTLGETSFFIREGLTSKGKPLSAYLEARNHIEALDYLQSIVKEKTPITPFLLREYHSMLFKRIDTIIVGTGTEKTETPIVGGEFKRENNHVIRLDGKILEFTDWLQVPGEVEALTEWHRSEAGKIHPIELAATFHHRLVRIHPFLDGNGRVARLMMNTILMQHDFTPAIILVEEKQRYFETLQAADDGDYAPLFRFLDEQVTRTLQMTVNVAEGREAFDFKDLSRMLKNIAERSRNIEKDLGQAVQAPEQRSSTTAGRVRQRLQDLLKKHADEAARDLAPDVSIGFQPNVGFVQTPLLTELQGVSMGGYSSMIRLNVNGIKRFHPSGYVDFFVVNNRYQVAAAVTASINKLDPITQQQLIEYIQTVASSKKGSIYEDEWDWAALEEFALEALKRFYQAWDVEMERRKQLIAQEEAEFEKQRYR
jgi:Fic family protein